MQKNLLFGLISTLKPSEVAEAGRWLASPAHNLREDVQRLFSALTESDTLQAGAFNRMDLWEKMFPGVLYNDQEFRLRCSYLLRALEDWMAWKRWQEEQLYRANYALAAYRERGLERHFHKRLSLARQRLEQSPLRSPDYYLALYDFESEVYHQDSVGERQRPKNLQAQDDALTCAMISLKLAPGLFCPGAPAGFRHRLPHRFDRRSTGLGVAIALRRGAGCGRLPGSLPHPHPA